MIGLSTYFGHSLSQLKAVDEHLQILSNIALLLTNPNTCETIRQATNPKQLFAQICEESYAGN